MRTQTRLVRRGTIYYFRARIPADLAQHFGAKREIVESLRTSEKRDAESRVRIRSVELDEQFEGIRRARSAPANTHISDEEIARIVAKATATRLLADEEGRIAGVSDMDLTRQLERLAESEASGAIAVARGHFDVPLRERADDWLRGHGYDLAQDSDDYRRFAFAFAKAQLRVNQQVRARGRGEPIDTPPMPPEGARGATSMEDLRDYWKKQKTPRPKTCIEADSILRRFAKANGTVSPGKVTRRHIVAFRDALVGQGRAPGVRNLLDRLA